jgi:FkbM family methyltransferase
MNEFEGSWSSRERDEAIRFCLDFQAAPQERRFVLGRNVYSRAIVDRIQIAALVDDFTSDREFDGVPIIRAADLPDDALVLVASGGATQTARRHLDARAVRNLDYFAFYRWSGWALPEAVFNEGFQQAYEASRESVTWLHDRLEDEESRSVLRNLIAFRNSYNLHYLRDFADKQDTQYFEDFLLLDSDRPVFVDIGGFDGFTTRQFIKRVPKYEQVYVFEPDVRNREVCLRNLAGFANVCLLPYGAGNQNETLRFSQAGSASAIDPEGLEQIDVRRIDDLIDRQVTYMKMDIEGAERQALEGARNTIERYRPNLAVCVYHRPSDFWEIPRYVLDIYAGYKVFLRHYTESIYETVMYFVPVEEG